MNVSRELLLRLQERLDPHRDAKDWGELCEVLRAAPAEDVRAVGDEPVISSAGDAWLWHPLRTKHGDASAQEEGYYAGWSDCLRSQRPVVLPEHMVVPDADCPERINAQGWNACLDEFKRLNP